jgi:hypothetical protein
MTHIRTPNGSMRSTPISPLPVRLRLAAAEAGVTPLETLLAAVGGALLSLYGGALTGADASALRLAAAGAFCAAGLVLGRLWAPGAAAVAARGVLTGAERAAVCASLALVQATALAALDPALLAFALGFWGASAAARRGGALAAVGAIAVCALAAILIGATASTLDPKPIGAALAACAALAVAAPLGLAVDARRLVRRGGALAAAVLIAAPALSIAALERHAPALAAIALAALAFTAFVLAVAVPLGRAAPRHAVAATRLFAGVGALALGWAAAFG